MEKILRGKYLVKKSKLKDGTNVVVLTGVFHPQNFNIDEIDDGDEMWVSDIMISSGVRFTEPVGKGVSPEDFISGEKQSPSCWLKRSKLSRH